MIELAFSESAAGSLKMAKSLQKAKEQFGAKKPFNSSAMTMGS